jgi:release factor glutamine methyltransferase
VAERVLDVARKAAAHLAAKGIGQARLDAELLLAGTLGVRRLDLYLQHDRPLSEAELESYRSAVRRRARREPVQYILGEAYFRELRLKVDRRVLIPRPETEVLVGAVLAWAQRTGAAGAALDLGTGSGAIALSLAREGSFERVVATDISVGALDVAAANAVGNDLTGAVDFRQGDLWQALAPGEMFVAVVSNPPYVAESDRDGLEPEVEAWEPPEALYATGDGLALVERIIAGAPRHLSGGGLLALEIGAAQAERVLARLSAQAELENARIEADLTGRPRVALAEKRGA